MAMTDEQFETTTHQIRLLEGLVGQLDLDGYRARIAASQALGPLIHPTEFRNAAYDGRADALDRLDELAGILNKFKAKAIEDQRIIADLQKKVLTGDKKKGEGRG